MKIFSSGYFGFMPRGGYSCCWFVFIFSQRNIDNAKINDNTMQIKTKDCFACVMQILRSSTNPAHITGSVVYPFCTLHPIKPIAR